TDAVVVDDTVTAYAFRKILELIDYQSLENLTTQYPQLKAIIRKQTRTKHVPLARTFSTRDMQKSPRQLKQDGAIHSTEVVEDKKGKSYVVKKNEQTDSAAEKNAKNKIVYF